MTSRRMRAGVDANRILVLRTDRMGDLILSTPLLAAIRAGGGNRNITVCAPPYALPVLEGNPDVDDTIPWRDDLRRMARELRRKRFDAGILLNPGFRSCMALLLAGIPFRTGPLSRPPSFLFLNAGLRQKRSSSPLHQSEQDGAFARLVIGGRSPALENPRIRITEEERKRGGEILRRVGAKSTGPIAGIHPGSGRSALRWPGRFYGEVGKRFAERGWAVVITGGRGEQEMAERMAGAIGDGAVSAAGDFPLRAFFGLLSHLDLFVAPSTGPLHAAAALGVPVASPYSPLPSHRPARWGPRTEKAAVLVPPVECPAKLRCIEERCPHHPCMERIEPDPLFRRAVALVESEEGGP